MSRRTLPVRDRTGVFGALFALLLVTGCVTRPVSVESDSCYASTDGLRYNHFYLRLNADKTYKFVLRGDISTWGTASGTWEQKAGFVSLVQSPSTDIIKFPANFEILTDDSLRLEYNGPGYSTGGTDLIPMKCTP